MSIVLRPIDENEFEIVCEAETYDSWNEEDRVLFYGQYQSYLGHPVITQQVDAWWCFDANEFRQIADLLDANTVGV